MTFKVFWEAEEAMLHNMGAKMNMDLKNLYY